MSLGTLTRGINYTADTSFYGADGVTPFVGTGNATWKIYDSNNNQVLSGNGTQDVNFLYRWYTNFTLPLTVPISQDGSKYRIDWAISNATITKTSTEYFTVVTEGEEPSSDSAVVILENTPFQDTLITDETVISLKVVLMNQTGATLKDSGELVGTVTPRQINGKYYYDYSTVSPVSELTARGNSFLPYIAQWSYTPLSRPPQTEIHLVYPLNPTGVYFINTLERYLDKARNLDINPSLRFNQAELLHFVYEGIARYNSVPPYFTNFTIATVPQQVYSVVSKCAIVEALGAWYLAEQLAAFNFQGGTSNLEVDRTPALQTMMNDLNTQLQDQIPRTKRLLVRNTSIGVLGVQISPNTNWGYDLSRTMIINRLRGNF